LQINVSGCLFGGGKGKACAKILAAAACHSPAIRSVLSKTNRLFGNPTK
jgi:hypothetical protein